MLKFNELFAFKFSTKNNDVDVLTKKLEKEDQKFRENVEYLMNIVNNQRQRIVEHLLGKDQEESNDQNENSNSG